MTSPILSRRLALALAALCLTVPTVLAAGHNHDEEKTVAHGYFEDDQIQPRELSDWEGEWQSIYPFLKDGTLDPVMEHKAEHGEKSADEYRAYYDTGFATDVDQITIAGDEVTFTTANGAVTGTYKTDGYEVLTYEKGNRGVRYIFARSGGDDAAPATIQFSDHHIAPEKVDHFHLYWGDDRAKMLEELTNWPTYFPADLTGAQIVEDMMAH